MSNDSGLTFWVGDLDGYVTISEDREVDPEIERLDHELHLIGEIKLLAGKSIPTDSFSVSGSEWAWAVHKAEHVVGDRHEWASLERPFIAELLTLGRSYALSRYAKWERLAYSSAVTATLPLGLKALINQFLVTESLADASARQSVQAVLEAARQSRGETAYQKTSRLQSALHHIADAAPNHAGRSALNREGMRTILSLARLHCSVIEANVGSLRELQDVIDAYETEWSAVRATGGDGPVINGRRIQGWPLRHIRPLIDLYPYSVRHTISRALHHDREVAEVPDRSIVVNELALAHCGILRMRRVGRDRTRAK